MASGGMPSLPVDPDFRAAFQGGQPDFSGFTRLQDKNPEAFWELQRTRLERFHMTLARIAFLDALKKRA